MKTFTIIGGVNGVGKSSFTGAVRSEIKDLGIIIDVDKITADAGGDELQGGKLALRRIRDCLEGGICFTQESTLSGSFVSKTAREARDAGYLVRLYYIALDSAGECLERIENRVRRGGHGIAPEVVRRRFDGRWEAVSKLLPYCSEAVFYDNDNGFRKVAVYQSGELLTIGDYRPAWLLELQEFLRRQ